MRNIFLETLYTKCGGKTSTRSYFKKSKLKTSLDRQLLKPGPGPWAQTLKNMDAEKFGINMGLKNMYDFRESCFIKTMCNGICCLKVCVLTDK